MDNQLVISLDGVNNFLCILMILFILLSIGYGQSHVKRTYRKAKVEKIIDTNIIIVNGDIEYIYRNFNELTTNATFTRIGRGKWRITMPNLKWANDTMYIANVIDSIDEMDVQLNWTWENADWISPSKKLSQPKSTSQELKRLAGEALQLFRK